MPQSPIHHPFNFFIVLIQLTIHLCPSCLIKKEDLTILLCNFLAGGVKRQRTFGYHNCLPLSLDMWWYTQERVWSTLLHDQEQSDGLTHKHTHRILETFCALWKYFFHIALHSLFLPWPPLLPSLHIFWNALLNGTATEFLKEQILKVCLSYGYKILC